MQKVYKKVIFPGDFNSNENEKNYRCSPEDIIFRDGS